MQLICIFMLIISSSGMSPFSKNKISNDVSGFWIFKLEMPLILTIDYQSEHTTIFFYLKADVM